MYIKSLENILGQSESGMPNVATGPTPAKIKKFTFTSKFNKFNWSCIYDLIEEKDQSEFSDLLSKIEANSNSMSSRTSGGLDEANPIEQLPPIYNDIKIFIRFNWYSFDEMNVVNPNVPFSLQASSNMYLGSALPSMSRQAQAHTSKTLLFTQNFGGQSQAQQQNYPFVRQTSETGASSSSLLYMPNKGSQSVKMPTPNSTLSTHSSSSTVYNQPTTSSSIQSLAAQQQSTYSLKINRILNLFS